MLGGGAKNCVLVWLRNTDRKKNVLRFCDKNGLFVLQTMELLKMEGRKKGSRRRKERCVCFVDW